MIVDESNEVAGPGPAARTDEEERALEIDMPEFVGGSPFVARAGRPDGARSVAAVAGEESIDLAVAERPDAAAAELGSDPPAVPVGQQADGQDEPLERRWQLTRPPDPRTIEERLELQCLTYFVVRTRCTLSADRSDKGNPSGRWS